MTVSLYANATFGERAQDWTRIADLGKTAFAWNDVRYVRALGLGKARGTSESVLSEARLEAIARGVAEKRFGTVWLAERSAAENLVAPEPRNVAFLSADFHAVSPDDNAPAALSRHLSMVAEVGPLWPSNAQFDALGEMVGLMDAQYGCIWAGVDRDRARSESMLTVVRHWQSEEPEWRFDIHHRSHRRWQFGPRVRGAYWGNLLSADVVRQLGGVEALQGVGAVKSFGNGTTYVQLTPTVGEALGEAGQERMARLQKLLGPVLV